MNKRNFGKTEWTIIIYVIILLLIGLTALYSATNGKEFMEFKKQIIWIVIGIPLFLISTFFDYKIISRFSWIFYIGAILLLIFVLFTGKINGASSWFNIGSFSMQPSEFAKIFTILFLANTLNNMRKK